MSGQAQVTPEMLTNAGNKATDAGESIAAGLTRLLSEIQSQSQAFQGSAGSTFQTVSHDLGEDLRGMLKALNTMAENVHAANRQYGSTDEAADREIASVGAQVPGSSGVVNALRGN